MVFVFLLIAYCRIFLYAQRVSYPYCTVQAARALANLAAHGDSNNNNAAVGREAGALEALVQLTRSPHDGVRCVCIYIYIYCFDFLLVFL